MTTLRDKITEIFSKRHCDSVQIAINQVMSAIKSKYGWTDEDCPFSYGDEIEAGDEPDEGYTVTFVSYLPQCRFPYCTRNQAGTPSSWKYARPVQKQGQHTTTFIEKVADTACVDINGKKYKLVEVK